MAQRTVEPELGPGPRSPRPAHVPLVDPSARLHAGGRFRFTWGPDEANAQTATGVNLPVVEHELANGMRFLVLPRRGAPTTSFVVQYRVGGVNEVPGTTGMVHLLEHLLFKAPAHRAPTTWRRSEGVSGDGDASRGRLKEYSGSR